MVNFYLRIISFAYPYNQCLFTVSENGTPHSSTPELNGPQGAAQYLKTRKNCSEEAHLDINTSVLSYSSPGNVDPSLPGFHCLSSELSDISLMSFGIAECYMNSIM